MSRSFPLRRVAPALVAATLLFGQGYIGGPMGCRGGDEIQGDVVVESQVRARWVLWSFADQDVVRDDAGRRPF